MLTAAKPAVDALREVGGTESHSTGAPLGTRRTGIFGGGGITGLASRATGEVGADG